MLTLPEIGQLVHARNRAFIVTEVQSQGLPTDALQPAQAPMHWVKLSSVEDDAFGEEIELFWELEPGATAQQRAAVLPKPIGFAATGVNRVPECRALGRNFPGRR